MMRMISKRVLLPVLVPVLMVPVMAQCIEFIGGTWEQELSLNTTGTGTDVEKFESVIEPQWLWRIGEMEWTSRWRIRLDGASHLGTGSHHLGSRVYRPANYSSINGPWYNREQASLDLRELYTDGGFDDVDWLPEVEWRVGKQQVVWGQADGLKVLDVVNPQSYREFILDEFEDSRIPLWMINLTFPVADESSIQVLWIPDTTYHELAETGTAYQITSPLRVPYPAVQPGQRVRLHEPRKPASIINDSDLGIRYSTFWEGWDLTLNYFHHYQDLPVLYMQVSDDVIDIQPEYERSHLLGGSASNAFGDFTLRVEMGYQTDTYSVADFTNPRGVNHHHELASVVGVDWQGLSDTLISLQWFQSTLLAYQATTIRDRTEQTMSALLRRHFVNETWQAELLALHSLNRQEGLVRPKISYALTSDVKVWLGADVFYGNRQGLYGQFDHNDRVVTGFEWGF